jgi:hypothetical protein
MAFSISLSDLGFPQEVTTVKVDLLPFLQKNLLPR